MNQIFRYQEWNKRLINHNSCKILNKRKKTHCNSRWNKSITCKVFHFPFWSYFFPEALYYLIRKYILWIKIKRKNSSNLNYRTSSLILHLINSSCVSEFGIVKTVYLSTLKCRGLFSEIYYNCLFQFNWFILQSLKTDIQWFKCLLILQN